MIKPIFLVGYMCSGKSSVGAGLSRKLGVEFVDLDSLITSRYGESVSDIFSHYGEFEFRNIEREQLEEVVELKNVVVALGGGTPCWFDNMERICHSGLTLFLDLPVKTIFDRAVKAAGDRPLLSGCKSDDELVKQIEKQISERRVFYERADIHLTIDEGLSVDDVVDKIIQIIDSRGEL